MLFYREPLSRGGLCSGRQHLWLVSVRYMDSTLAATLPWTTVRTGISTPLSLLDCKIVTAKSFDVDSMKYGAFVVCACTCYLPTLCTPCFEHYFYLVPFWAGMKQFKYPVFWISFGCSVWEQVTEIWLTSACYLTPPPMMFFFFFSISSFLWWVLAHLFHILRRRQCEWLLNPSATLVVFD